MQTKKAQRHQQSEELPGWLQLFQRFFFSNIRTKIILPFLVLTLIVAILGIYVVTQLVVSSIDDLLTNALLEAGRVVSDDMALSETEHLEAARGIAFTTGLNEALRDDDRGAVVAMAHPLAVLHDLEYIIVTDASGQAVLHTLRQNDGTLGPPAEQFDTSGLPMVRLLLDANDPTARPKRGLVQDAVNERYYYFTALPIGLDDHVVGVVVVGTSLDTLLTQFKNTSLADVIIYLGGGRAVDSTFTLDEQSADSKALLDQLSTTPAIYEGTLYNLESTMVEGVNDVRGRSYRLARSSLRVSDDILGVFAVALPLNFVVESQLGSRNTYTLIFVIGMGGVILVGYLISQRITNPLSRLVRTSQAVADGDLEQRTGIASTDEIGILAGTFDEMTTRLAERTHALEEAVGRMRAILSSMGDGVILEDLEGNQVPLNATAETLLEEMASGFMSGPLRDLPAPEDYDPNMADQLGLWHMEHRRFEIGQKVVSAHSAVVRTDDDERLGTVVVMRDVTAEVEAERLKDEFITHVSHELRTPLTAIKGYGELLLSGAGGPLKDAQHNFLETINRNVDDLIAMVNELLDFSEMQASGRLGVVKRPMRLSTLIEDVVEDWQPRMDEKKLAFQVKIPAGLPPIDADSRRLRWAVIHLVRNALQYTPSGGSVTLRLFERNDHLVLDVIDTGIGISATDLENLFDRFYRVTNMPADEVRGLGVGLYLSNAIIEAHGGEITVVSEEGAGSTFSLILPTLQNVADDEID
ncbi:MAG: HAMP domain-containing protein [Chloroflexi bacterium]|nr:HAMP domain-containing protein [Chloroflexota bacterium]